MKERELNINIKSYFLLVIIVLLLKLFTIDLAFGIKLDFSSIAIILILIAYGRKRALIITTLTSLISIILLDGRYIELLQILEIYVLHIFRERNKNKSIMFCDIKFWGFIGIPITYLVYLIIKRDAFSEYYYFELIFKFINVIFNAFLTEVIYTYYLKSRISNKQISISFNNVIIHVLIASILIPFLANMFIDIVKTSNYISDSVNIDANEVFENISDELNKWDKKSITNLQLSGIVEKLKLKNSIEVHSKYKPFNIYIINNKNKYILNVKNNNIELDNSSGYEKESAYNEYLYRIVPISKSLKVLNDNWVDTLFIYYREVEDTGLYVVIEAPMEIYKERILEEWTSQFEFLVFFIIFIYFIMRLLNKWIFNDLSAISHNTKNLNNLLEQDSEVLWPNSRIMEVREFVGSLKEMTRELQYSFLEIKSSKEKLYKLAYYDSLTELPNRLYFKKTLDELAKNKQRVSIIFLDLNRFKIINDTLGHDVGDKLLVQVASRLKELTSKELDVFRLGGDEFVIVAKINNENEVITIGEKVISKFKENFILEDISLSVTCSLGASIYPDHATNINNIVQYADIAMYIAKENNSKTIQMFNNEIKENLFEKLLIEKEIFNALENDEFTLLYQPKYDSHNEEIKSLEALIRWTSKNIGVVSPEKFISIAEESDLILKIDKWVITKACKENKRLQDLGYKKIPISVNISAKNFASNEIEKVILHALEVSGLEAKYLIIEITEGVLIKNFRVVEEIIRNLNKIGISISIDDFGKGYSSFNQLMRLPINEIKVDKTFIRGIEKDKKKEDIVASMVELAHRLNLNVVAEGIETKEEKTCAKKIGFNELQGYLFAKPATIDKIQKAMEEESKNER